MQLGKLQATLSELEERDVELVALSVDPPSTSAKWAVKKGFTFTIVSDPEFEAIDAYDLRNEEAELAYHAVFVLDEDLRVTYRKVARRRVRPAEILHALDGDDVECCAGSCGKQQPCRPVER